MIFSDYEIDILLQAMDEWESSDVKDGMIATMMLVPFVQNKEDFVRLSSEKRAEALKEKKSKKEVSILIKAKLVGMKGKEQG